MNNLLVSIAQSIGFTFFAVTVLAAIIRNTKFGKAMGLHRDETLHISIQKTAFRVRKTGSKDWIFMPFIFFNVYACLVVFVVMYAGATFGTMAAIGALLKIHRLTVWVLAVRYYLVHPEANPYNRIKIG